MGEAGGELSCTTKMLPLPPALGVLGELFPAELADNERSLQDQSRLGLLLTGVLLGDAFTKTEVPYGIKGGGVSIDRVVMVVKIVGG